MTATYDEVNERWPWSRVVMAAETIRHRKFEAAYPTTMLARLYMSANTRRGGYVPPLHRLLLPSANPFPESAASAPYSEAVVLAFVAARRLRYIGNEALDVLGVAELRASGWST